MSNEEKNQEQDTGMKIHLEISMDEIFVDEYDEDLQSSLQRHIIYESVQAIWKKVKDKVESTVNAKAIALIESKMDSMIYDEIMAIIKEDRIKARFGKDQSLQEFVESKFNGSNSRHGKSVDEVVAQLAKQFGEDMKNRYDSLFASQLIIKLRDQGMLKEEYSKIIDFKPEKD